MIRRLPIRFCLFRRRGEERRGELVGDDDAFFSLPFVCGIVF
jgi:hypothetical protein